MNHAVKSLIEAPQNNFRIFKNGNLIYGEGRAKECQMIFEDFFNTNGVDCER